MLPAFPKQVPVRCRHCGKEWTVRPSILRRGEGKYCSPACWYASGTKHKNRKCRGCGAKFENRQANIYCSEACFRDFSRRRRTRACVVCGSSFEVFAPHRNTKTCSKKCKFDLHRQAPIPFKCRNCGAEKQHVSMGGRKRIYCSKECQTAFMVGVNSPLYRGNRRHDRGPTWGKQSRLARKRDGNTCQGCGATSKELASVDHIVPFRLAVLYGQTDGIDPNHLDNLLCLCRSCHGKKTQAEARLLAGDVMGFRMAINAILPMDKVEIALSMWKIGRKAKVMLPFDPIPKFITAPKPCPPKGIANADRREA